jgi:hypothetical protein
MKLWALKTVFFTFLANNFFLTAKLIIFFDILLLRFYDIHQLKEFVLVN